MNNYFSNERGEVSSSLYEGTVIHSRIKPKKHKLNYNVFCLFLDLDEIPFLEDKIYGFKYNCFSLMSFMNKDYGPGEEKPLKPWIINILKVHGVENNGSIKILCYPRILGYVFNPICNYFCYNKDNKLAAIIHEVSNTFGEKHFYLCKIDSNLKHIRHEVKKCFHVSPFITMDMNYNFHVEEPNKKVTVSINETDKDGTLLFASFSGIKKDLEKWSILRLFFSYPMMTLKVTMGIHWQALQIWLKGIPVVKKPPPPVKLVTLTRIKDYK